MDEKEKPTDDELLFDPLEEAYILSLLTRGDEPVRGLWDAPPPEETVGKESDIIAENIFIDLITIDINDLWDNSDGEFDITDSDKEYNDKVQQKVYRMVMDRIEAYLTRMKIYRGLGSRSEEKIVCTGVIKALNRYEASGSGEFYSYAVSAVNVISREIYIEWKAFNPGDGMNLYDGHLHGQ
jgi:hypothetical protein